MGGVSPFVVLMAILGIVFAPVFTDVAVLQFYCDYIESGTPFFDVPPCKGTGCVELAYPVKNQYGRVVGRAWDKVNRFLDNYASVRHACSFRLVDENGNPIMKNIKRLSSTARSLFYYFSDAVYLSSLSNRYAIHELQSMVTSLERAGVADTTEPDWAALYRDIIMSVEDLNRGLRRTELGRAWVRVSARTEDPLTYKELKEIGTIGLRVAGVLRAIPIFSPALKVFGSYVESQLLSRTTLYDYVNSSVGLHNSVREALSSLRRRYVSLRRELDEKIKRREKDFSRDVQFIEDALESLREENLSVLASFLKPRTYVGEMRVNISIAPSYALAMASRYEREYRELKNRYEGGEEFLKINEEMKRVEGQVSSLREEVQRFLSNVEGSVKECVSEIQGHRFKDRSLEALAAMEIVKVKVSPSLTGKVEHCLRAIELVKKDSAYGDLLESYKSCKRDYEKRWRERLQCRASTPLELYQCCVRESRKKESEFRTSEQYLRYVDLYDTLYSLAVSEGLQDFLLRLMLLPRNPGSYEELYKSFSKLLSMSRELSKILHVSVSVEWNGFLSADGIADVTLYIDNPLSFPVEGEVEVPFDYLGYSVERNGLFVEVVARKVKYRGTGSASILFQASPAGLEEEVLGFIDGRVQVMLRNQAKLPVSTYMPFTIISISDGAYFEDSYLYLFPGASAIIERPAVEMNSAVNGDEVTFFLRNISPYRYRGTISFDVNAVSGPSYCFLGLGRAICKVELSPGEERMVRFRGVLLERNEVTFEPREVPPPGPTRVESSSPKQKTSHTLIVEFNRVLRRLKEFWDRAKELNVTDLLPYDRTTLSNLEHLEDQLKPLAVPVVKGLEEEVRVEAEGRTKLLETLANRLQSEEMRSAALLARKSILTGDYITPLAISRGSLRYLGTGESGGLDPKLVLLLLFVGIAVYVIKSPVRGKKRRRIPRF